MKNKLCTDLLRLYAKSLAFAAALAISQQASAVDYAITGLGGVNTNGSNAYGINNNGQVVGFAFFSSFSGPHAFLYSGGTMTDIGALAGAGIYTNAVGINSRGQIVGDTQGAGTGFMYSGGTMTGLAGGATGINDSGQVVGGYNTAGGGTYVYHAYLYDNGTMSDLGTLGGTTGSYAYGINNNGQVVGSLYTPGLAAEHAFLYSGGSMSELGAFTPYAINNNGQVAGCSGTQAILYSSGTMTNLGNLGIQSCGYSINNSGQVVGTFLTDSGPTSALLYSDGRLVDLNSLLPAGSGWTLLEARGINDFGQIVGTGIRNGHSIAEAFLMTPVPLPAAIYLFGSGLLGLLSVARHRKQ